MGEMKTLQSYLERYSPEWRETLRPQLPVFVTKSRAMESADRTRPIRPNDTETVVMMTRPAYANPWDDISVLLLGGPVFPGQYSVGRVAGASLAIPNPTVSKDHGVISKNGDSWAVRDTNSTNGVFISQDSVKFIRIESNIDHTIQSQEYVRFGTVDTQFLSPDDFLRYVSVMHGTYAQRKKLNR